MFKYATSYRYWQLNNNVKSVMMRYEADDTLYYRTDFMLQNTAANREHKSCPLM